MAPFGWHLFTPLPNLLYLGHHVRRTPYIRRLKSVFLYRKINLPNRHLRYTRKHLGSWRFVFWFILSFLTPRSQRSTSHPPLLPPPRRRLRWPSRIGARFRLWFRSRPCLTWSRTPDRRHHRHGRRRQWWEVTTSSWCASRSWTGLPNCRSVKQPNVQLHIYNNQVI